MNAIVRDLTIVLVIVYVLLDFTIAVTPKRYQTEKWFGFVLRAFRYISLHVHFDEPGTLVMPGLGIPLRIGQIKAPTPGLYTMAPTVFAQDEAVTPVDRPKPIVPPAGGADR